MKTWEKRRAGENVETENVVIDNSLSDRPISHAELKKVEAAREFLKEHPVPEHLLKK